MTPPSRPRLEDLPDPFDLDFTHPHKGLEGFHVIAARPRAATLGNQAVLVLDSDVHAGEALAETLRNAGYHAAIEVTLRGAAHHILRLGAPAVVLIGADLPEMKEPQFLQRLRHDRLLHDTAIIVMGSHADRRELLRALQAGADGYLVKPVQGEALVAAVRAVLGTG